MGIVTGSVGQQIERERLEISADPGGREPAFVNGFRCIDEMFGLDCGSKHILNRPV